MVAERRFGPIVVVLFLGLGVLVARLFQVQILEHETWAREAQNLVRSAKVVPYHRGRILDREGRVLVRDDDTYEIEFCYRDFRRGHPLGEIAHARSVLEMRAVPLSEALVAMEAWAVELVSLSPRDLDGFRRGRGLATESFRSPAIADAERTKPGAREVLAARASDLRYYVSELLHFSKDDRPALRDAEKLPDNDRSYAAIVAAARKTTPGAVVAAVRAELAASREHLAFMAELVRKDLGLPASDASQIAHGGAQSNAPDSSDSLGALVAALERNRRRVEDSVADELFAEAAEFSPGRLSTIALGELVDVAWIGDMLRWDRARTVDWAASRRAGWLRELEEEIVPRIVWRVSAEEGDRARADRLLSELAHLFLPSREERRRASEDTAGWLDLDEVCVQSQLDDLFRVPKNASRVRSSNVVLPLQDPDVRAAWRESNDPWSVVGAVSELLLDDASAADAAVDNASAGAASASEYVPPRNSAESAARWHKLSDSESGFGPSDKVARAEVTWLALALERRFLAVCDRELRVRALGDDGMRSLAFADDRIGFAREQEKFIQRDRQNRPIAFPGTPSYELVHLLARYPERYRGFDVRESTRRIPVACDEGGNPVARLIVGSVRRPSLSQIFAQAGDLRRLSNLQSKLLRSDDDEEEMRAISARLYRRDEYTGGSGIEDYFDRELRGKFGYREIEGLEQRAEGSTTTIYQPPVDGEDVTLTLDVDLQIAAEQAIQHPDLPRDPLADALWVHNPVGAIVLVTPDGEVLAAASSPAKPGLPKTPGRDAERTQMRERTMQRPTFNPPGSVFKPFVAAYALDRMQFDPHTTFVCGQLSDGKYGYREMHCHGGHGGRNGCDLRVALADSCNSYFAQLGERMKPEQLIEMAEMFGFGEPTGILRFGGGERSGIREHATIRDAAKLPERLASSIERLRFACGLGLIEATPMQVARATAGLVTGRLPELRIDRAIGGVPTPHAGRDLGLSPRTLAYIRDALEQTITHKEGGTAYDKGLDSSSLGFTFACKTGSADTWQFKKSPELTAADEMAMELGKMRKHTWIAGWFPAEDPKAVLVVYLHDVSETASHTSVYVAAQFLRSPAVRKFVEGSRAKPDESSSGVASPADARETKDGSR